MHREDLVVGLRVHEGRVGRRELDAGQHAEHAADREERERRDHHAHADDGMVDRGEALQSRPGGPYRDQLPVQSQRGGCGRRLFDRCAHLFTASSDAAACASAAAKSSGRWTITVESHACVTETAEFVAEPFVAARLIGLDAQSIHMPGNCVDLAGESRHPEGVDDVLAGDHDVDRRACGQMQDVLRHRRRPGRDSGRSSPIAGPRPRFAVARFPGSGSSRSPATERIGDERQQDDGRQREAAEHDPARGRYARAPTRSPDHQNEEDHDQREEHGGAGEHHPPQRGDRVRRRPAGIERRQRPGATARASRCSRFGSPHARR